MIGLVYIRIKRVNGKDYAYLTKCVWMKDRKTAKQITLKYLGKASDISLVDIPIEYRDDPQVRSFLNLYSNNLSILVEDVLRYMIDGDYNSIVRLYEKSDISLLDFYEKVLKVAMYRIGDLWVSGEIDIPTEHACSNIANAVIKIINGKFNSRGDKGNILICTPLGELHTIASNMLESILLSRGYEVYNIAPSSPTDTIVEYVKRKYPDIILISITYKDNLDNCIKLVKKIRKFYDKPIIVGGQGIDGYGIEGAKIFNGSLSDLLKEIKYCII